MLAMGNICLVKSILIDREAAERRGGSNRKWEFRGRSEGVGMAGFYRGRRRMEVEGIRDEPQVM